jgi:3-oxoacyl-(acyl-carrier-protein) synthase
VLCDAYAEWRLPFVLAEGAAALVLGRTGNTALRAIHDGVPFFNRGEARGAIRRVCGDLAKNSGADLAVGGANGTRIDADEQAALDEFFPDARTFFPKRALGEALGAGALIQTVYAALALEKQQLKSALVTCPGLNHQASGLMLNPAM